MTSGDFELSMDELRAMTAYAVACAEPTVRTVEQAMPYDERAQAALAAARVFAEGGPRSNLQRTTATAAHRAGREARPKRLVMPLSRQEMPQRRPTCIPWLRRPKSATSWGRRPTPPGQRSSRAVMTRRR